MPKFHAFVKLIEIEYEDNNNSNNNTGALCVSSILFEQNQEKILVKNELIAQMQKEILDEIAKKTQMLPQKQLKKNWNRPQNICRLWICKSINPQSHITVEMRLDIKKLEVSTLNH